MQKLTHFYRLTTVVLFLLIVQIVSSQISANLNIIPPFSPFYRDYAGYGNNKAIITLIYTGGATNGNAMNVFIAGSITKDDNSISIAVRDDYRPNIPLALTPNIPKTITGGQLKDVFGNGTTNDLIVTGISKEDIIQNQALPEGTYNICIKVKDFQSGRLMAQDCRSIFIVHSEPPQIIPYINNEVEAKIPQYVNVNWSPVTPFVQGIRYRLRVVKLLEGISPTEALDYATQVVLEKSNLVTTNFPIDLASGVKLDTGAVYVMQVTATAPTAYIKNEGKSEPAIFKYKGFPAIVPMSFSSAEFKFLNPRNLIKNKPDTLKVNADNAHLINWGWIKTIKKDSSILDDLVQIKKLNLQKYNLTIKNTSNQNIILQRVFERNSSDSIKSFLQMSQDESENAGFMDGEKYKATIDALDNIGKTYNTYTSNDFIYKKIKGDTAYYNIPIRGVLNYAFKGFPEIYPVKNTEIVIDAYKKTSEILSNNVSNYSKKVKVGLLTNIATKTVTTNENGSINASIQIPQNYFKNDSIYYRLKIGNRYYVDTDLKTIAVSFLRKDSAVEFGSQTAKTYAYKLKLKVQKKFPSYTLTETENGLSVALSESSSNSLIGLDNKTKQTYNVNDSVPVTGIPVVLYRENKQDYIPTFEGDIKQITNTGNKALDGKKITVVAVGTTQIINNKSYAVFEKLLATNFKNEEYKILAVRDLDMWLNKLKKSNNSVVDPSTNTNVLTNSDVKNINLGSSNYSSYSAIDYSQIENVISNITSNTGGYNTNFVDSTSFIAEVMPYTLPLPSPDLGEAGYYRTVEANYDIISCKPPTSIFKGRLSYVWPSDKTVKRPLANTHFRVIVDYVDGNNKHVGKRSSFIPMSAGGSSYSYTSFKYDNSDEEFLLLDQDATMAEGTTDGEGNFTIETVNINKKGSLGAGTLTTSSGGDNPDVVGQSLEDQLKEKLSGGAKINPWYGEMGGDENGGYYNQNSQNNFGTQNNTGAQGGINTAFNVSLDNNTGSYELNQNKFGGAKGGVGAQGGMVHQQVEEDYIHGPNPSNSNSSAGGNEGGSSKSQSAHYNTFSRVFRIAIDGGASDYYYPSKEVVVIQPLENCVTPKEITHYVREFELKTYTKELNGNNQPIPLYDMQVTVFRDPQSKPKNLPQGEGDGKYQYKELINPEYNTNTGAKSQTSDINASNLFTKKFEQLWSAVPTGGGGFAITSKLLQKLSDEYYIESSSFVDKTSKTYQATIAELPDSVFNVNDIDWTNPQPVLVEAKVILKPLVSRALVTVRDVVSGKPLTSDYSARAIYSKKSLAPAWFSAVSDYPSVPVDKYGKAEVLANQYPLTNWVISDPNPTNIYFYCSANGYKTSSNQYKAAFVQKGYQSTFDIGLSPGGKIKGKIITQDKKNDNQAFNQYSAVSSNSVTAYLQVDSGKVFETNSDGTFEINVPLIKNAKLKIIPKDVAYFDTTYVVTDADSKLSELDLKNILVSRRKHRILFYVTQKVDANFVGPASPVSGGTIQLGETTKTTQNNGDAKFEFENVSVNNYTFVVRGAPGSGYIPKTVNVHSEETKGFVTKKIELEKGSEITGVVKLDNVPVKNARVYIDVSNSSSNYTSLTATNLGFSPAQYSTPNNPSNQSLAGQSGNVNTNVYVNANETNVNAVNQYGNSSPSGTISNDANLVVAYTDKNGKYTLRGVPVNNQQINIRATLDTTFTVSGDMQQVSIKNGKAVSDLNLTGFNQAIINKIYGFPLTIEKITPVNGNSNQVKVSGLVHWTQAISDFKLNEVAKSVRIEETVFDLVTKNGVKVGVANGNEVNLSGINSLKLSYLNKYNVQLINVDGGTLFDSKPLKLVKNNDYGKILGKIKIVDNSFNYPSSYLSFDKSEFYLAKVNNNTINNIVDVAASAYSETEANKPQYNNINIYTQAVATAINGYQPSNLAYNICDKDAKAIKFELIRFNATANPLKSYIDKTGKIHLNADLSCHIENSQPKDFTLNIPDMVLDENKVYPASSAEPIKLKLEDWSLEVKDWSFSVEEGGIISSNSLIRTAVVDIPVKKFVLRKDMFLMADFQMNNLSLAGGKFALTGVDPTKANLNYEYKIGSLMDAHWNFCLLSNGNAKVASLPAIEGLYYPNSNQKYPIDFNYIQILSNNEMLVQLKQNSQKAKLLGNKLASFEPLSIYSGPDYISINGLLNVGAPRMSDISLNARWTSPSKNPDFETVSTDFEGKGFVHFTAEKNNIIITNNLITIEGKVVEKPSKTFNPIPSTLYARSNSFPIYEVMMQKDWVTQLTEDEPNGTKTPVNSNNGGYKLKISSGGMSANNLDWSTCKFSGTMKNNTDSKKTDETDNIKDCTTTFEVLGDITANSNEVAVTGVDTPFGSMTQVFDFANKQLIGTLKINKEVTIGTFKLHSGTIETCFGLPGFYVAGGCYAFIPAGILAGDYNTGFMAGSYPLNTPQGENLWKVTNSYIDPSVQNQCYKNSTQRLSGIYTAFNREIINVSVSQNYILASGYVKALALLGGDMYINVSNGWKIGLDGYVHVDVGAGLSAITGTSISGSVKGDGKVAFQVGTPSFFQASMLLDFEASISQSLGFTTISKSISVGCSATGGTSGFDFSLGSGGAKLTCP